MSKQAVADAVAKEQRMTELEKLLAYEWAKADIESLCLGYVVEAKRWFEVLAAPDESEGAFIQERVDLGLEYLTLRGLIERHPRAPWVHVMEVQK